MKARRFVTTLLILIATAVLALIPAFLSAKAALAADISCVRDFEMPTRAEAEQVILERTAQNTAFKRSRNWSEFLDGILSIATGRTCDSLLIEGRIEAGDHARFLKVLTDHPLVFRVYLLSQGGSLIDGLAIGKEVRRRLMETYAPHRYSSGNSTFTPRQDAPDSCREGRPCLCASSCFLIWAGGIERHGNLLGLHRPSYDEAWFGALAPGEAARRYAELMRVTQQYLADMEIEPRLAEKMVGTPKEHVFVVASDQVISRTIEGYAPSTKEWIGANCETLSPDEERDDAAIGVRKQSLSPGYIQYLERKSKNARNCTLMHLMAARLDVIRR